MRALTPAEAAAWPRRDTIRILANSAAPVAGHAVPDAILTAGIPLAVSTSTDLSSGIADRARGRVAPLRPAAGPPDVSEPAPGDGAQRVSTEAPSANSAPHDVFVKNPIDHPTEFIDCARHGGTIVDPECAQTFVDHNLILKASYRRTLVPQWREIHAAIVAYLAQHEVQR